MRAWLFALILVLIPQAVAAQQSCGGLIDRGWRGMNCFYCMHWKAAEGSAPVNDLLLDSCLKKVMVSFILDGSFGYDESEIKKSIDALRGAGRDTWIHLYVYNGPAQRRWQSGVFQSFAVMDPVVFQHKLLNDRKFQGQFAAIVKSRLAPVVSYALARGARVSVAAGLEDNLNDSAYKVALKLIQKNLPAGARVTHVRNPCFRCVGGVGRYVPPRGLFEEHDDLLFARRWNGIINTDGRYFRFSSEKNSLPTLYDLAPQWVSAANARGNAFLLWIPHFQDTPPGLIPKPLTQRNFRGPTANEAAEIIDFLRY